MIRDRFESRSRKVNTMQDNGFEEKLKELGLHVQDYIEDHSYPSLVSIEKITMSGYDGIHDGGFIVLKVQEQEMPMLKEMTEQIRMTARRLRLGGAYLIEGTTVLRVFAH